MVFISLSEWSEFNGVQHGHFSIPILAFNGIHFIVRIDGIQWNSIRKFLIPSLAFNGIHFVNGINGIQWNSSQNFSIPNLAFSGIIFLCRNWMGFKKDKFFPK